MYAMELLLVLPVLVHIFTPHHVESAVWPGAQGGGNPTEWNSQASLPCPKGPHH